MSLCLLISVISLMILHHNYIIINFLLIILSILVTHRYITEKTLTQSIIIILVYMIKSKSMLNSKMQIIIL